MSTRSEAGLWYFELIWEQIDKFIPKCRSEVRRVFLVENGVISIPGAKHFKYGILLKMFVSDDGEFEEGRAFILGENISLFLV
jgi:hypothetical protein